MRIRPATTQQGVATISETKGHYVVFVGYWAHTSASFSWATGLTLPR
jgi:hypothetical protein